MTLVEVRPPPAPSPAPGPDGPRWVTPVGAAAFRGASLSGALPDELTAELRAYLPLVRRLVESQPLPPGSATLVDEALELWARPGFEILASLPRLRFEPFAYQVQAAQRVLRHMQGRAILADEVGLGKTIEAALVASELRLRGLAARVLVVVPVGLVDQWQEELDRKFALPSVVASRRWEPLGDQAVGDQPIVIASLASARRPPLRDALASARWDLVIADEAHRLKNPRSASARLVRSLQSRYLLLLTATPVENRLDDLFQLASLVRPGALGTPQEFRARHRQSAGTGPAPGRSHNGAARPAAPAVRNLAALQARSREVVVRHRRSEVALMLPRRLAETRGVRPAPDEAELYRRVSERVRSQARGAPPARALALRSVQRLAGSSPQALLPTLAKVGWADLGAAAARVAVTEKARALVGLLAGHRDQGDKVVVFSAFHRTIEYLAALVAEAGLSSASYHGGLSRSAKEAAIASFRNDVGVLLSTEAAGEGRNLQFCHVMVNFDLPWNPMQLEQRLGRIHRIGQHHEVLLTNLVTRGTIEERILGVLEAKINLFELVVGELDMILGRVDEDFDFESSVFAAHVHSGDDTELGSRLEALGDELAHARQAYLQSRSGTDELVGGEAAHAALAGGTGG